MYGLTTPLIDRQALHAARLTIRHPQTDEPLTLEADPPADFRSLLSRLREGELLLGDQPTPRANQGTADTANRRHRSTKRNRRRRTQRIR